jgi:hypothetical protein
MDNQVGKQWAYKEKCGTLMGDCFSLPLYFLFAQSASVMDVSGGDFLHSGMLGPSDCSSQAPEQD